MTWEYKCYQRNDLSGYSQPEKFLIRGQISEEKMYVPILSILIYVESEAEKNDIYIILTNSCVTQLLIQSILNYFILLQSIRKWKVLFNLSQTNLLYPKLYLLMMAPKIQDSGTRFVTKCNGDLQEVFNRAFVKIKVGFFEFQNSISYSRNSNSSMIFFCRDD